MEVLLGSAFDLLSFNDHAHIRRGLKQLDGIFTTLCLPSDASGEFLDHLPSPSAKDPAHLEFIKLQDSFEWNVASQLLYVLRRLYIALDVNSIEDILIPLLNAIQGAFLLHKPSRRLLCRRGNMMALLSCLDGKHSSAVQCAAILTLVCALLEHPRNTRVFEELQGLAVISQIFKDKDASSEVRMRTLEFFYFYLMPEEPPHGLLEAHSSTGEYRSTDRKQALLSKFIPNVRDLVEDLRPSPGQTTSKDT